MVSGSGGLTIVDTHPIQYQAPLFRAIQSQFGIPVTVIYGSDFSVAGYRDLEFGETFSWDTDLLSGYRSVFLSRVSDGGTDRVDRLTAQGLKMALLQSSPRAVLVCGYKLHFHQAAFFYAWKAGIPVFFRGDADHLKKRELLESWIRDLALRWFYDRCVKLLYVGELPHRHFKRLGVPDEKLVFSPRCVDASSFRCSELDRERLRRSARSELELTESDKAILFSGKLVPRKAPDLLLQAVKRLPEKVRQEAVVFFLGSGELKGLLAEQAKMSPQVRVHLLGFKNQMQLSPYFHAADIHVIPSLHSESWGLAVNEALHHGLPSVASDRVGCVPDLIDPGVTGEIFQAGSVRSLSEALCRAFSLIGRPVVREQCRRKVGHYTVEEAARGIDQAYRAVVKAPSPSRGLQA